MLSIGSNIQASADPLQKIPVEYLFNQLRNPKPEIAARIRQLRALREIDDRQYTQQKRSLPYFVCSILNPPYRRSENFAYSEFFCLDIDHIRTAQKDIDKLRKSIQSDSRLLLAFSSPSGDGLKLIFKLKERCWDSGLYSLFYKSFIRSFGIKFNISDIIDSRTSDVCRACFISIDPEAYFNPSAMPVNLHDYIDTNDVSAMFSLKNELSTFSKPSNDRQTPSLDTDPDAATMNRIRQMLSGKPFKDEGKVEVFVPEELNSIIDGLVGMLRDNGLIVNDVVNIQYGKSIRIQLGIKKAEINLFYGKRGFTVVECPRTGTNPELNRLSSGLIKSFLKQLA